MRSDKWSEVERPDLETSPDSLSPASSLNLDFPFYKVWGRGKKKLRIRVFLAKELLPPQKCRQGGQSDTSVLAPAAHLFISGSPSRSVRATF